MKTELMPFSKLWAYGKHLVSCNSEKYRLRFEKARDGVRAELVLEQRFGGAFEVWLTIAREY